MLIRLLLLALCLLPLGCGREPSGSAEPPAVTMADQTAQAESKGEPEAAPKSYLETTYWPMAKLDSGSAWISCEYDYAAHGDGERLTTLEFFGLVDALSPCREAGMIRLRYKGKINPGFTALVQRVAAVASRMELDTRILDIDSAGGHVEEAIKAGDNMAEAHWSIWVREGSVCHSACVLILAAGDGRSIAGKVGIHRLMRDRSKATSRAELAQELKEINAQVADYLERNGVAGALADQMMTVANRKLRILTEDELQLYGLEGRNAAQDDLDRIRLARKCGDDFVRRKDAFAQAIDAQCMEPGEAFADREACGRALLPRFGFPDAKCPDEDPLAERQAPPKLLRATPADAPVSEAQAAP